MKPTVDNLRAAQGKFETEQKRIDLAHGEALKDRFKQAAIRKRMLRR